MNGENENMTVEDIKEFLRHEAELSKLLADPPPSQELLDSLKKIEDVLNEGAAPIAERERVPDGKWRIHLVAASKGSAVLRLKAGPIAQIVLTWPNAQPELKRLLTDAFRAIHRNKMYEAFSIESVLHARRNKEANRKWMREEFGDESDILLDLVPRYRLEETIETKYTLKDTKTGKSVSVTSSKTGHFSQNTIDNWIALSRMVREVEPIMIDSETPELDKVAE